MNKLSLLEKTEREFLNATDGKIVYDSRQRPLHDLRISVIDRCNFRCNYCMPAEEYHESYSFLDKKEWLTFEEIERLAALFVQLGVAKIRLTGGEPLLRPHLHELIQKINGIPANHDITLTTNGVLLAGEVWNLKKAGLKRLTVSLDTLDEEIFRTINSYRGTVSQVLEGIREAETAGFHPIKINAVIQKGVNDHTILDLVRYFKPKGHIVRFIEYMDVGNRNNWKPALVMPSGEILQMLQKEFPLTPLEPNYHGEVAERYGFTGGEGEIGFISSISQPFCGSCTRARLSTDGKFYTCLFAGNGFDLKTPLRRGASNEELLSRIKNVWRNRTDRYSEERIFKAADKEKQKKIEMYQIGG